MGMVRTQRALLLLIPLILMPAAGQAGSITIATDYAVRETPSGATLEIGIQNRGKAAAHDVRVMVEVVGEHRADSVATVLEPGARVTTGFPLAASVVEPGRQPVVIRTYYRDAAGKRYTALVVGLYGESPGDETALSVSGGTALVPVNGAGRLAFVLENTGEQAISVELVLYLPDELAVRHEHGRVDLAPGAEQALEYEVVNYSALEGSRYPVTLLAQYRDQGRRVSVTGTGRVRIGNEPVVQVQPYWIWILIGVLLPVVTILSCRRAQHMAGRS